MQEKYYWDGGGGNLGNAIGQWGWGGGVVKGKEFIVVNWQGLWRK